MTAIIGAFRQDFTQHVVEQRGAWYNKLFKYSFSYVSGGLIWHEAVSPAWAAICSS